MLKAKVHTDGGSPNIQIRVARIENGFLLKAGAGATYAATPEKVREIINDMLEQLLASPEYQAYVLALAETP